MIEREKKYQSQKEVAIVGISCMLPGADCIDAYWDNIINGRASIQEVGPNKWQEDFYSENPDDKNKSTSKWLGCINQPEMFDSSFFHVSEMEANNMDPLQRIMLQETWKCIEDAGISLATLQKKNTAVIIGSALVEQYANSNMESLEINRYTISGTYPFVIPNRISNFFGFTGASKIVDTACSSSSVALGDALNIIRSGRSAYAISGGINVLRSPHILKTLSKMGLLSKTGKCSTFDADADGIVVGEGVVTLLLTSVEEAKKNHLHIYALIKDVTVNHLGNSSTLVAPSKQAQYNMIKESWSNLSFDPATITYAEMHGTGTRLGDPIEVEAMADAYRDVKNQEHICNIGSVKANIGHLLGNSGFAGVLKIIKMFETECIPPQINVETLNPLIEVENSPLEISIGAKKWNKVDETTPLRASISSIGITGVNTYIVLEKYEENPVVDCSKITDSKFFTLSAKSQSSLINLLAEWKSSPEVIQNNPLENILYTLSAREQFSYRLLIKAENKDMLIEQIRKASNADVTYVGGKEVCFPMQIFSHLSKEAAKNICSRFEEQKLLLTEEEYKGPEVVEHVYKMAVAEYAYSRLNKPEVIQVNNKEELIYALVLVNVITAKDAINYIKEQNSFILIKVESILDKIQVQNISLTKIIVNQKYLKKLCCALSFSFEQAIETEEIWHQKVKKLVQSQRVFRKYVSDYNAQVQDKISFSAIDFINNTSWKISDITSELEKVLTVIIISVARAKLNEKWSLHCRNSFKDERLDMLSNYIIQDVITLNDIVAIYTYKTTGNELFINVKEVSLSELIDNCDTHFQISTDPITTTSYEDMIERLWKCGIDLDWKKVMKFSGCRVVKIPQYCFDKKPYRIIYQGNYVEGQYEEQQNKQKNGEKREIAILKKSYCSSEMELKGQNTCKPSLIFTNSVKFLTNVQITDIPVRMLSFEQTKRDNEIDTDHEEQILHAIECIGPNQLANGILVLLEDNKQYGLETYVQGTFLFASNLAKAFSNLHMTDVKVLFVTVGYGWEVYTKALSALFKTIYLEDNELRFRCMYSCGDHMELVWKQSLQQLACFYDAQYCVESQNGILLNESYERYYKKNVQSPLLTTDGVYIIFGGAGGIGKHLVRYIAQKTNGMLIICGQREQDLERTNFIEEIRQSAKDALYVRIDIAHRAEMEHLLDYITIKYGKINGIFNLTAIVKQGFLEAKETAYLRKAIRTKVDATVLIDEITKELPLDFICNFSSISAVIGDYGLTEYAYANHFMDDFCSYRERLRNEGKRSGITISINWPFWSDGGLTMTEADAARFEENTGMCSIGTDEALASLNDILNNRESGQYCIINGNYENCYSYIQKQLLLPKEKQANAFSESVTEIQEKKMSLEERVSLYFKKILCKELEMKIEDYDEDEQFENYGVDSILIHKINRLMTKDFKDISTTIFFDYECLREITEYMLETYEESVLESILPVSHPETRLEDAIEIRKPISVSQEVKQIEKKETRIDLPKESKDIAIIGISGRFPEAHDLNEFWDNLYQEKDCVHEIPKDRWDIDAYYDRDSKNSFLGKMNTRCGGFIDGIDQFDPYLFKITPADAKGMDPQERILLEVVYEALEYAGYSKERIQKLMDSNVGVFVGSTISGYRLLVEDEYAKGNYISHNAMPWALSNRISYCFGWNGPSYTIDSACSSSLNAFVAACQNIRMGTCKMAVVGGVNLHVHPSEYIVRSQLRVMSPTGRCYTFSENADGYVPGEGIGAILLKTLEDAKADGDLILGVVKGIGTNHVGHTSGFTVPSKGAQSAVIRQALKDAGLRPDDISLIEAHGTGTKLGDPIEINGLTDAFSDSEQKIQFCAISSVKSNIGHLEGAAGVSAIVKVLLQLNYRYKVASLHYDPVNSGIHFEKTPFYIQKHGEAWEDGKTRIAGISSFGAGGSNAHVIISEYQNKREQEDRSLSSFPVIFSAMSEYSLLEYLKRMMVWLNDRIDKKEESYNPFIDGGTLKDIAYTTQIGQNCMDYRIGILADSKKDLLLKIEQAIKGRESNAIRISYPEHREKIRKEEKRLLTKRAEQEVKSGNVETIMTLFLEGASVDWDTYNSLHQHGEIIMLPAYCFENERFWIDQVSEPAQVSLKENDFTPSRAKEYSIDMEEVREHVIAGETVLAGTVQMSFVFETAKEVFQERMITGLSDVVFLHKAVMRDKTKIEVYFEEKNGEIQFEVKKCEGDKKITCSKGKILEDVLERTDETLSWGVQLRQLDVNEYYERLRAYGFLFGESYQAIKQLFGDGDSVLGIVSDEKISQDETTISPQQLDGALQTAFYFMNGLLEEGSHYVPVALGQIQLVRTLSKDAIAYTKMISEKKKYAKEYVFDVAIYDEEGNLAIKINNYCLHRI